jgi:hypothetical protein
VFVRADEEFTVLRISRPHRVSPRAARIPAALCLDIY